MSAAALSIAVYAVYLLGEGAALFLAPNVVLPILGLPPALDHWVRIVGMVVLIFGIYYLVAARFEFRPFFVASVVTRLAVPVVFVALVAVKLAPAALILLTPADILFAAWTWLALRRSSAPMPAVASDR